MASDPRDRQVELPDAAEVERRLKGFGGGIPGLATFYQGVSERIGGLAQKPHDLVQAFRLALHDAESRGELEHAARAAVLLLVPRLFATLVDDEVFVEQAKADWIATN
ncbi:hypothetical protein C8D87_11413 [Lentzea atacamensis]|uniref:Uncharacterized protein n=1 Tax=Lentzea atacamensis TaxID=531938 RepID=A0ABX9DVT0_9PSEU|nr:hypothetical protein [Lentzea atacamensis]RAS59401.1 hypothetical protein C8D87_11413 [Lentzea atacamensis]